MNRSMPLINLLGVLLLAGLCIAQWQVNRRANLQLIELDRANQAQRVEMAEQEKTIKGQAADLDSFRQQLIRAHTTLKETETRLATTEKEVRQVSLERDQLRVSVTNWAAAVTARDEKLKGANEELQKLAIDRNEVVGKFNELAENYNSVVKDLNEIRARSAGTNAAAGSRPGASAVK
jgi:chromosome segregation ATPase